MKKKKEIEVLLVFPEDSLLYHCTFS